MADRKPVSVTRKRDVRKITTTPTKTGFDDSGRDPKNSSRNGLWWTHLVVHIRRHPTRYITFGGWILLSLVSAYLAYRRYPYAFKFPNFYGEDGNAYVLNIYTDGILKSLLYTFNGYLILLQYAVVAVAMGLNAVVGNGFVTLPKSIALVSYLTFGAAASLPWLLFRRQLGHVWALVLILMLTYVPMGGWDYTIFGTVGNLKFLFFYVAVLLVVYRKDTRRLPVNSLRFYAVDILLLLFIATNTVVAALLPVALWRHKNELLTMVRQRRITHISRGLLSMTALCGITLAYATSILIMGIPKLPGYLDGPIVWQGLVNALFRGSWYGFLYPAYAAMNPVFVYLILLVSLGILVVKKYRGIGFIVLYSVFVATVGFVLNRPGVTAFFGGYLPDGGPGQFFYGGTMAFIFGVFYVMADWVRGLRGPKRAGFWVAAILYLTLALPVAGYGGRSYATYSYRPPIHQALVSGCAQPGDRILIEIYPATGWRMYLPRDIVCKGI